MSCPFCSRDKLEDRVFYDDGRWFAFLAAPYHTKGHAILAARKLSVSNCPEGLKWEIIAGFDNALAIVSDILKQYYQPKDILFASMRGDIAHSHCHLIPRWDNEEKNWRKENPYKKGHLLEFLGHLEKVGDSKAKDEREEKGWNEEEQRSSITETLRPQILELRTLACYKGPLTSHGKKHSL